MRELSGNMEQPLSRWMPVRNTDSSRPRRLRAPAGKPARPAARARSVPAGETGCCGGAAQRSPGGQARTACWTSGPAGAPAPGLRGTASTQGYVATFAILPSNCQQQAMPYLVSAKNDKASTSGMRRSRDWVEFAGEIQGPQGLLARKARRPTGLSVLRVGQS